MSRDPTPTVLQNLKCNSALFSAAEMAETENRRSWCGARSTGRRGAGFIGYCAITGRGLRVELR